MRRRNSSIAGCILLIITLCCAVPLAIGKDSDYSNLDLTGTWQLRFDPPFMQKVDIGGFAKGTTASLPKEHELNCRVVLNKNQGGTLMGSVYWDEGDMSFAASSSPTFVNGELRLPLDEQNLIGTAKDKDTIAGKVSRSGKSVMLQETRGTFDITDQRRFKLVRVSKGLYPHGVPASAVTKENKADKSKPGGK